MTNKYTYGVLEMAACIHSVAKGTGDYCGDERKLIDWLRWRIADGWEESDSEFDRTVRKLAELAIVEFESLDQRKEHAC